MRIDEIIEFSDREMAGGLKSLFKKIKAKAKKLKKGKLQYVMPDGTVSASKDGFDYSNTTTPIQTSTYDTYKSGLMDMMKNPLIILIPSILFLAYTMRPERKAR